MIVSFRHNFIYFRPKKTGSSTIAAILRPHLEDEDLRRLRATSASGSVAKLPLHSTARQVKAAVPPEFWDGAFKFASERHPYEKAVSLAYFRIGKQQDRRRQRSSQRDRFPALLDRVVTRGEYAGFEYYSIDGTVVASDFIRHETLETDLRRIASKIGLQIPDSLPRNKGGYRTDRRSAHDILSEKQKGIILDKCLREFEFFSYRP